MVLIKTPPFNLPTLPVHSQVQVFLTLKFLKPVLQTTPKEKQRSTSLIMFRAIE